MRTADLDYELPERLIAQVPTENRDQSRLLVIDRQSGRFHEDVFHHLGAHLEAGDCLALNDTRVIRARIKAKKTSGGKVEIFLLHERAPGEWECLVKPGARVKPGTDVTLANGVQAHIEEVLENGRRRVRFDVPDVLGMLEAAGEIPLPPYIRRSACDAADAERYQTIYAQPMGAVAAPTAGLHFTGEVFEDLVHRGIGRAPLTLHIGYGTFKPVLAERLEEHQLDPEEFDLSEASAQQLNDTRAAGRRVVAVGTTTTRVLETQYCDGRFRPGSGTTRYYIYPPHTFRGVDALITNFHLPRSSLLALVCAFAGIELTLAAYRYAVENEFRFYSYGDAMLVI